MKTTKTIVKSSELLVGKVSATRNLIIQNLDNRPVYISDDINAKEDGYRLFARDKLELILMPYKEIYAYSPKGADIRVIEY